MAAAQRRGGGAGGNERGRDRRDGKGPAAEKSAYIERVVAINRVAKVVKGGRRFSFTALVVIGDGNGKVGLGYGKAKEVPLAIQKGTEEARRNLFEVPMAGSTIIHPVIGITGGGRVMMKPAAAGTGVIAGGPVRAVLESVGIKDILSKSLGSKNAANVVKATLTALQQLRLREDIYAARGLHVRKVRQIPDTRNVGAQKLNRQRTLKRNIVQVVVKADRNITARCGHGQRLVTCARTVYNHPSVRAGAVDHTIIHELARFVEHAGVA